VRGYRQFTIGPKDSELNPRGGSRKLLGNVEFLFPFPGLEGDRSVRMSAFVDSGMVADSYKFSELRYSTGLAVLWVSPLGPLKVSAALPIGAKDGDRRQPFQFTIGGVFQ
jgi:outer membrane protein insertion porin family